MSTNNYGALSQRVKAILTDGLVLMGLCILSSVILSVFDNVPDVIRIIVFIFIFFIYDPLFTSFIGATIGHMIFGLKVRQERDENKKLIFPLAFVRFIVKAFLGWISLITISSSNKGKAIHDSLVGSVVINTK